MEWVAVKIRIAKGHPGWMCAVNGSLIGGPHEDIITQGQTPAECMEKMRHQLTVLLESKILLLLEN